MLLWYVLRFQSRASHVPMINTHCLIGQAREAKKSNMARDCICADGRPAQPGFGVMMWANLVSGIIAGTTASVITHPFDVIKTQQMAAFGTAAGAQPNTRGTLECIRVIVSTEGTLGLWKGLVSKECYISSPFELRCRL